MTNSQGDIHTEILQIQNSPLVITATILTVYGVLHYMHNKVWVKCMQRLKLTKIPQKSKAKWRIKSVNHTKVLIFSDCSIADESAKMI
jgi:hypothetical protein